MLTAHLGVLLEEFEASFGERVPVPRVPVGSAVWVEIDVRPTVAGRLLQALYKPPYVLLESPVASHLLGKPQTSFRLVPSLARAGFLLSPMMARTPDFGRLVRGAPELWRDNGLAWFRLSVAEQPGAGWTYDERFRVRFSRLAVGP